MEFFIIYPKIAIPLEERIKINENEWELKKIKNMRPFGKKAEIREIEYYWDEKRKSVSYIIKDLTEERQIVGTKSFFRKDLENLTNS